MNRELDLWEYKFFSPPGDFVSESLITAAEMKQSIDNRVQENSKDCYTRFFQLLCEGKSDKRLIQDRESLLPKRTLSGSSSIAPHAFFSPPCSPLPAEPALINHAVLSCGAWHRRWPLLSAQRQSPGKGSSREGRPRSPMRQGSCLFMVWTPFWWTNGNKLCWLVQWQKQESWA